MPDESQNEYFVIMGRFLHLRHYFYYLSSAEDVPWTLEGSANIKRAWSTDQLIVLRRQVKLKKSKVLQCVQPKIYMSLFNEQKRKKLLREAE